VATKTDITPIAADTAINVQWRAIIAGVVCASALAYVLPTYCMRSQALSDSRFRRQHPLGEMHHGRWFCCQAFTFF
jgi:hypothetical protein